MTIIEILMVIFFGLFVFWLGYSVGRAVSFSHWDKKVGTLLREINNMNDRIIGTQEDTIKIKSNTIDLLNERVDKYWNMLQS